MQPSCRLGLSIGCVFIAINCILSVSSVDLYERLKRQAGEDIDDGERIIQPERLQFETNDRSPGKELEVYGESKRQEQEIRRTSEKDPTSYLEQFGYLPEPRQDVEHSPEAFTEAIRSFQRMAGLPTTGRLDRQTRTKMAQPRCGMPDMVPEGEDVSSVGKGRAPAGVKAENYHVPGYKWTKTDLTWRAENYSPDMSQGSQRRAFYKAFKYWSDVTPLTFRESSGRAVDIDIKFAQPHYDHGDGYGNRFDGKGGTLAHAFFPEDGSTHFDEAEDWTEYTEQGVNLEIVAAHEFGHALGLGHSNVQTALMAPFYAGYDRNFKLDRDDIRGIQSLYGSSMKPKSTPRPPTRTTPRPTKKPGSKKPNLCTGRFDDVIQDRDGSIYGFSGKWMWKMGYWAVESGWPQQARRVYDQTPPYSPRAVVYSWRTRYTYFFKKNKIQQFYGLRRVRKTTVRTRDYPLPQAAFMSRDGNIYILSGDYYWRFDENRLDIVPGSQGRIRTKWPGLPGGITAAVRLSDGYVYFFKGTRYRKYDERARRVLPGYPKNTAAPWMGPKCSRSNSYEPK